MDGTSQPGGYARRLLLRRALGGGTAVLIFGASPRIGGIRNAMAADSQVVIDNFTFTPTPLTIKVGTTVTWVNHDDIPHSIYCPDLKVHSHALDTDDSFSFKFEQVGTFDYVCGIHPHMRGQVVVQA